MLSVRLEPEAEQVVDLEVEPLKITKSEFVGQLLRDALRSEDSLQLLQEIREKLGLAPSGSAAQSAFDEVLARRDRSVAPAAAEQALGDVGVVGIAPGDRAGFLCQLWG